MSAAEKCGGGSATAALAELTSVAGNSRLLTLWNLEKDGRNREGGNGLNVVYDDGDVGF